MKEPLFLSIHPQYIEKILSGEKTVELRKRVPRVEAGATVLLYSTSPVCQLVGYATIKAIHETTPAQLWPLVGAKSGIHRGEYNKYYAGKERAVGIELEKVCSLPAKKILSLESLRKRIGHNFRPPQGFRYFNAQQVQSLGI